MYLYTLWSYIWNFRCCTIVQCSNEESDAIPVFYKGVNWEARWTNLCRVARHGWRSSGELNPILSALNLDPPTQCTTVPDFNCIGKLSAWKGSIHEIMDLWNMQKFLLIYLEHLVTLNNLMWSKYKKCHLAITYKFLLLSNLRIYWIHIPGIKNIRLIWE